MSTERTPKTPMWIQDDVSSINNIETIMGMLYHQAAALEEKIPVEYLGRKIEDQNDPAANAIIALTSRIEDCLHEINDFQDATEELNT